MSSWYVCDFDAGIVSYVKRSVELSRNFQNDGVLRADRKLPNVPVIFVEVDIMSLTVAKAEVHHLSATRYPASLEEYQTGAPKEMGSIEVLAIYLKG